MTYDEKQQLIHSVAQATKEDPELFKDIVNACSYGMMETIREERQRAADMETVAIAFQSMSKGSYRKNTMKWIDGLIPAKLDKWKGKLSFNWGESDVRSEAKTEEKI